MRTGVVLGLAVLLGAAASGATNPAPQELRDHASDLAYSLDYGQAIEVIRQAIAARPQDSANHRVLASILWQQILFARGAVTVDHYLGGFTRDVALKSPPPDLDAEFRREIATSIALAEQQTARNPDDPAPHDDLGAALGLQATYIASVDGRLLGGFRVARRSYDEEERVLQLDPNRKDAELIVGTYRYIVSTLSLPMRVMAYVAGFSGGRERGIQLIEDCAASSADNHTDAKFALVLVYNREHRYDDAMRVLEDLRRQYPRNRLVVLETGATAVRGRKAAEADALLTRGLAQLETDTRPRIPGEEALWHLKRGAARVLLGRSTDAVADLRVALAPGTPDWVEGRAHLQLAHLAQHQGDNAAARREASLAIAACDKGNDPICVDDAKTLGGR